MELRAEISRAITEMGFVDMTEIQKQTIPLLLEGRDVIGHSHTGTGKTAAYAIPILQMLDFELSGLQTLVIAPTRELAVQIHDEICRIAKYLEHCRVLTVFGGDPIGRQIIALKNRPQIVVGTPGRIIDHIRRKTLRLDHLRYLILDEADEMLKMGFQEDIESILLETPPTRQTLMFSATMPKPILALAKQYMIEPELIRVIGSEETSSDVIQQYYKVKKENKTEALYRLINIYRPKLSLVFCNTKVQVDQLTQELIDRGLNCDKIHGDLPQTTRMDVLRKFHNGVIDVMVATDVAARGLDIKAVEAVFNYDVPEKADYYVHRIGRTGRIGHIGYSFTLVSRGELRQIEEIERLTKSKIKKRNIPTYDKVQDVKHDKLIERLQEYLTEENFEKEYLILNKAIQAKLTEDQIIVGLLKMLVKEDKSDANIEDINEEFISSKPKFGAKGSQNTRFHLNLGKNVDLTVSDILDFISSKVKVDRREIRDIAILTEFSFFSVPLRFQDDILAKLNNQKLKGRRVFLSISKPKKAYSR
ncbi:MAG: DEAD/DEAH box helicase [Candidatus Izemoplasmatales bacterium]|nr:DEAD/DEAH box helicase [Candidatus Izemoplasmatales bacterium]NLF48534.1 DEAD/DEAH box helicase [Acholeplasmataceae bacterium]MDD4354496.1 DEAD/DEAH box helicase [Candidatus Izemoplasmatales bacterium]MDD4987607.1 DEAD/DEAH box helicase [Candidatus Izemoplasmatales bacterium]MDD5601571.1 DEAD/DEAH box helicase [Candidatus Izemoplasmatales bacterium]